MGSEKSSKIRLTDNLPKAELPLLDTVSLTNSVSSTS